MDRQTPSPPLIPNLKVASKVNHLLSGSWVNQFYIPLDLLQKKINGSDWLDIK
jgi:hypothetical protein